MCLVYLRFKLQTQTYLPQSWRPTLYQWTTNEKTNVFFACRQRLLLCQPLSALIGTIHNFKESTLLVRKPIKMIMNIPSALMGAHFPYASRKSQMDECVVGGAMASAHVYEGCTNDPLLWSDMSKHPWKPAKIECALIQYVCEILIIIQLKVTVKGKASGLFEDSPLNKKHLFYILYKIFQCVGKKHKKIHQTC